MRRAVPVGVALTIASMIMLGAPLVSVAGAQESQPTESRIGARWLSRIDPWHGIPQDLALRFGESAVSAGLTPAQAARLLNDGRFVAAVGAPDQGWGLLEAMAEDPAAIADAWNLLGSRGDELTRSGDTSFQYALMIQRPELRNPYLEDLGYLIAARWDGIEVLVDMETGRQVISGDALGRPVTAPGGGPLPTPSISPEEAAAMMWEEAGVDPNDPSPIESIERAAPNVPTGPGLNFRTEDPDQRPLTPVLYLLLGAFALSWVGYAGVMLLRRLRHT